MELKGDDGVIHHFLLDCKVRRFSKHTLLNYTQHLNSLAYFLGTLGITELEQVTVNHLRKCMDLLMNTPVKGSRGRVPTNGATLSISSVRGYVRVWKAFFNWCYQEELVEKNPVTRLSLPRPTKRVVSAFTTEQVEKMLESCDLSTEIGFRDYVILLLLLDTGVRLSEICGLRVHDVHDTYIKVMGKGRKEREIGLHPDVAKLLWKYIHKHRHPKDPNEPVLFLGFFRSAGMPLGQDG